MKLAMRASANPSRPKVFIKPSFGPRVRRLGARVFGLLLVLGGAIALAPTAAALDAASPVQQAILQLFLIILVLALIIAIFVHVLLLLAVKWYRDSPRWRPPKGHPKTNDRRLEFAWTVGPVIILAAVATATLVALPGIERPASSDYTIDVIGVQWAWLFKYPDWNTTTTNISSTGTLYVQQGLTFFLNVTSNDVIHSFYVPDLGIKIDAVPGIVNHFWVRADRPGTYTLQCAEFCGLGHSQMHGEVVVFAAGSQDVPYGPPPSEQPPPPPPGGAGLVVPVEFEESGGASPEKPWSVHPSRLQFGEGLKVTLRAYNNETTVHGFSIGAPYNLQTGTIDPQAYADLTFWTNTTSQGVFYWCFVGNHRVLGMEGLMNVTAPEDRDITFTATGIDPRAIDIGPGQVLNLTLRNTGSAARQFGVGPPYAGPPILVPATGAPVNLRIAFNLTTESTWFGDPADPLFQGSLRVEAAGISVPPPPLPSNAFPVIEVTAGLTAAGLLAAIGLNWKLGRDVRRREQFPPEEER